MMTHSRRRIAGFAVTIVLLLSGCLPGQLTDAELLRLRTCESGDNYRKVSKSGKYRGAYQFDDRTWREVGGSGDPAAAPPAEQDLRARLLEIKAGLGRWPVCGRRV